MKKWLYPCALIIYTLFCIGRFMSQETTTEIVVPGKVFAVDTKTHYGNRHYRVRYFEIISFDFNGQNYRFKRFPPSWFGSTIGSPRQVAIDPANPEHARALMHSMLEKYLPEKIKQHPDLCYSYLCGYGCFVFWGICLLLRKKEE